MKTITTIALMTLLISASCTKTPPPPVNNPPPDTSAFVMSASVNGISLKHHTMDTLRIDSAAGVKVNVSWPKLNKEVQLWVSFYSADSTAYRWEEVHGYEYSHEFIWASSILPKRGMLNILGIPEASSKKKPDTIQAYIIIK